MIAEATVAGMLTIAIIVVFPIGWFGHKFFGGDKDDPRI